ncbi:MAG: hypothetical protein M3P83_08510, partial [Actinomycetota bacterium]|nr:hypothetical protein [Actinomycetota bacterium]
MPALRSVVAAGLAVLVAGCSSAAPERARPAAAPAWSASFVQDRPDQDSRFAHVVVRNTGASREVLRAYRLRWPGYTPARWQPTDRRVFQPGYTYRFRTRLPRPRCGDVEESPAVRLALADGSRATAAM